MPDDHMAWEEYRATVEKMASIHKSRTSREEEVEKALGVSMPDLLRRLMDEYDGRKRPALKDLNGRLDDAEMDTNVSNRTWYSWLDKYHLD